MNNFTFYSPTKIYFGRGTENSVGDILSERKIDNVLVVIGRGSVRQNGLLNRVEISLKENGIKYHILEGVRANPTFDLVKVGIDFVRQHKISFILAIGGGSVIDSAKCIAVNYDNDGDIKDFNFHRREVDHALPIGVILTISAAGSELSNSCVIQDDETGMKMGFNSDLVRPVFAIENPELTITVNKEQTAYGIVDILMHTLERYFSYSEEHELADEFALGLLKNVFEVGLLCYNDPMNYEYRARLMLASSLSHNGITSVGKGYSMPVHQLEHPLSGHFVRVAHGCGLAILFPSWAKYYYKYDLDKFALLGNRCFGLSLDNLEVTAIETIKRIEDYFHKLDMPSRLSEIGLNKDDVEVLINSVSRNGTRVIKHHKKDMDEKVVREIYISCL